MSFRIWLEQLRNVRGHRPLWPVLLGAALDSEFQRQRSIDEWYKGDVFKNRDDHCLDEGEKEERLVAQLYRLALADDGCLQLGSQRIWLLGFQWPTQGGVREMGRRADLVGMTSDGGIVVFEAKRASGDAPIIAITEGLDYLACLLRNKNFEKILIGFNTWISSRQHPVPDDFSGVVPSTTVRPTLVVLAPEAYYSSRHARSIRGKDWPLLAAVGDSFIPSVCVKFAATDFRTTTLWLPPTPKKD
ncbi:MAG: hypothetical protein NT138_07070 [Planctomycetales bacterium]|nr:hypothetical protein [Planctomycetales bacterium]